MTDGHFGQRGLVDDDSEYALIRFIIREELSYLRTTVPVKVVAVHLGTGSPPTPPTVDVLPLINQMDGQGNKTDHATIYGIPVSRNQGSSYAIVNDPHVGDVGHIHVSDRDTASLKANSGAQSNPGSFRRHSLADGIYVGAILNPANPTQYVQFTDDGIIVGDKNGNKIEMMAGFVKITTAELRVTGDVIAGYGGGDSVSMQNHLHGGVTSGASNTAKPVAGT